MIWIPPLTSCGISEGPKNANVFLLMIPLFLYDRFHFCYFKDVKGLKMKKSPLTYQKTITSSVIFPHSLRKAVDVHKTCGSMEKMRVEKVKMEWSLLPKERHRTCYTNTRCKTSKIYSWSAETPLGRLCLTKVFLAQIQEYPFRKKISLWAMKCKTTFG